MKLREEDVIDILVILGYMVAIYAAFQLGTMLFSGQIIK